MGILDALRQALFGAPKPQIEARASIEDWSPIRSWSSAEEPARPRKPEPEPLPVAEPVPEPEGLRLDAAEAWSVDLEPIAVEIEYLDVEGNQSTRTIAVQRLVSGSAAPCIVAICYLRSAIRHFRIDRIQCVVLGDGEIVTAQEMLKRFYDVEIVAPTKVERTVPRRDYWNPALADDVPPEPKTPLTAREVRERFRPPLSILVGLARSDGAMSREEITVILDYIRAAAEDLDIPLADPELLDLPPLLERMKTRDASLRNYVAAVQGYRTGRLRRFISAARTLADIDGILHEGEVEFWSRVEDWMRCEEEAMRARADDPASIVLTAAIH